MASLRNPEISPDQPRYPSSYVFRNINLANEEEEDYRAYHQICEYVRQDDSLILLMWQREYEPEVLYYEGSPAPTRWSETPRYPADQATFKFIFDDIVRCTVMHKNKIMKLNILLENVYVSGTGIHDETHLKQINAAQIPFYWLFLRLYQGVSVNRCLVLQDNVLTLEGVISDDDGILRHRITYQFDLERNECTYKLYYYEDRLD